MAVLHRDGAQIHYEVFGEGYPLVLFAPGGLNSIAVLWRERPDAPGVQLPWINPCVELSDDFMVIAMDQRNAGSSSGPITTSDGWPTYTADHLALLDHLNLDRVHVMGGCIGSSYGLGLCQAAPDRVSAAVLQNPIGLSADNRQNFMTMFDSWAEGLQGSRDDVSAAALPGFRHNMFGGDFVFSVDRAFVRSCPVPLLILAGNDAFHPRAVAEEIADLAPQADLLPEWSSPTHHDATLSAIRSFLLSHTPKSGSASTERG